MAVYNGSTRAAMPNSRATSGGLVRTTLADELQIVLFIGYFITYVLSNASTSFEPSSSPVKHIVMGAIAAMSLACSPAAALHCLLMFSPVLVIYALGGLSNYAAMAALFALALPSVGRSLSILIEQRRRTLVRFLFAIALAPAVVALVSGHMDTLWSDQYGRDRLLLGYWHPKEAAASLALPLSLWLVMNGRVGSSLPVLIFPALLWVVGSRNVALAVYIAIGLWRFPRSGPLALAALLIVGAATLLSVAASSFDILDELSSLRLSVWQEALSDPPSATDDGLAVGNRLAIDSYYVEVLASAGAAGLALFVLWAAWLRKSLSKLGKGHDLAKSCFWAILVFSAFDSGIVSTGNLMHVMLWAFAAAPLVARAPRRRRRRRPNAQPPAAAAP